MASVIVHNFPEATGLHHAALIGLGVVLFAITIVVNVIARSIANRSSRMVGNRADDRRRHPRAAGRDDPAAWILQQRGLAAPPARQRRCANAWMIGSLLVALVPVVVIAVYVVEQGRGRDERRLPHEEPADRHAVRRAAASGRRSSARS